MKFNEKRKNSEKEDPRSSDATEALTARRSPSTGWEFVAGFVRWECLGEQGEIVIKSIYEEEK